MSLWSRPWTAPSPREPRNWGWPSRPKEWIRNIETHLNRYLTYSVLFHIAILTWLTLAGMAGKSGKTYYTVDFVGSGRSLAPAQTPIPVPAQKPQKEEAVKTKYVNPREDLLIKSKAPISKKEREVVSYTPPLPTLPLPEAPRSGALDSRNLSSVPTLESGVGIGLSQGSSGGTGNFPYAWYVQSIKKKLDAGWNVSSGFDQRIYAQIAFSIGRDGSLKDVEVEESSKNDVYDRAALRAVQSAAPLPALPPGYTEPELRVHVRFALKR